jgi:hypothetical protein
MKKYYIGVLAICAAALVIFVYVAALGISTKQDAKTLKAAQSAADKLDSYIDQHQSIPATLEQAGITDRPDTITYEKQGTTSYKFCATYKGSSAPDLASPLALYTGGFPATDSSNSAYLYISPQYKKGQNCQTVTPYLYSSNYYSPSLFGSGTPPSSTYLSGSSCDQSPSASYKVVGSVTVASVDHAKQTITFSPASQNVYDLDTNKPVPTITSRTYTSNTLFCNLTDFSNGSIADVKPGSTVTIYLKSAGEGALSQVDL